MQKLCTLFLWIKHATCRFSSYILQFDEIEYGNVLFNWIKAFITQCLMHS